MWRSLPFPGSPLAAPERLHAPPILTSLELPLTPRHPVDSLFPASEAEGQKRLAEFIDFKIGRYAEDRNRMDLDSTSGLSPYLRFGMVSARQAAWAANQAEALSESSSKRQVSETWLNELIWREFYAAILYHFPEVRWLPSDRNCATSPGETIPQGSPPGAWAAPAIPW